MPIVVTSGAIPYLHDSEAADRNYISINRSTNKLTATWSATNSINAGLPLAPQWHIGGSFEIILNSDGSSIIGLIADNFPAYEFYRYPKYTESGLPNAVDLGHRDQTNISALNSMPNERRTCYMPCD